MITYDFESIGMLRGEGCSWAQVASEFGVSAEAARSVFRRGVKRSESMNDEQDAPAAEVPDSERAIFKEFNPKNSVPTFVFGCKYYRVGNGYERADDLDAEVKELKAVIDALLQE